jgi:hypothetical protein
MVLYNSVSCLFVHYPSSNLVKFTTFQRLVLSPSSGDKRKGGKKEEVILAGDDGRDGD